LEGEVPVGVRVSRLFFDFSFVFLETYHTPTHQEIKPAKPPCATRCAPLCAS
jgi:hypothetical protein